eukprot:342406-Amorphochlora_amoeboformis.AAC.1
MIWRDVTLGHGTTKIRYYRVLTGTTGYLPGTTGCYDLRTISRISIDLERSTLGLRNVSILYRHLLIELRLLMLS